MPSSFSPLSQYSLQILELLQKSASQKNPAWFLYKNKTRSCLFMAESLTRLLINFDDRKKIQKAHEKIKKLEDLLGEIDDYDCLYLSFSKNKKIKKAEADYFLIQRDKVLVKLNEKLIKNDFYQELFHTLSGDLKIDFNNAHLVKELSKQITKELKISFEFYSEYPDSFDSMEGQVHELRRKLRWLSIYAQSFEGIIVLDPDKKNYAWEKKFITSEEIKSPYNKVPVNKKLETHIHYNKKAFLALSYVVSALGKIKDEGLNTEQLAKAIRKTSDFSKHNAKKLAIKKLGLTTTEQDLFKQAHHLANDYFVKHNIHALLIQPVVES